MGRWQDRLIHFRDFAYPPAHRSRMTNTNIGDAPAHSFAEYVNASITPPTPPLDPMDKNGATAIVVEAPAEELDTESGSDSEQGSKSSSRRSSSDSTRKHSHARPTLAHRVYTQNLRVQANAKSLRARLLSGPLVDIYVGEARKHWSLHRNLLCHHSDYLTHELLPSEENKDPELRIELPEDDPSGFELLVKWLYQGKLDDVSDISDPYQQYDYAVACHALWLICDRFDMPQLKNLAIDQFRQGLYEAELVPDANEINFIYRKSQKGSPFRRLVTKIAARQIMDPHTDKDAAAYLSCFQDNPEFGVELINTIKNDSGGILFEDPTEGGDSCLYHDHHDGPNCHQKGKLRTGVKTPAANTSINPTISHPAFQSNYRKPASPPVAPGESTKPAGTLAKHTSTAPVEPHIERAESTRSSPEPADSSNRPNDDNTTIFSPTRPTDSPEVSNGISGLSLTPQSTRVRTISFSTSPKRNLAPPKLQRRKTKGITNNGATADSITAAAS